MKPNQTLRSSPRLSSSSVLTIRFGCCQVVMKPTIWVRRTTRSWTWPGSWSRPKSVPGGRHRTREDVDQRAGDLDADRADDDSLDPLLGRQRGVRLNSGDLPEERE